MAGRSRPSFLKKQKEDQRRARAALKREQRRARKQSGPQPEFDLEPLDGPPPIDEAGEPSGESTASGEDEEAGESPR